MKFSAHFSDAEFRCKCCESLPDEAAPLGGISPRLIQALEELRKKLGNKPLTITPHGGYRCKKENARVKDRAKKSQHILGRASDVVHEDWLPYEIAEVAETILEFKQGGIGLYNDYTHVDVRGCYGQKSARWKGK